MSRVKERAEPAVIDGGWFNRDFPEGWSVCAMGDVSEVVGGGTPKANDPANFSPDGHSWITPADLSGFTEMYIRHGSRSLSDQGLRSCSARLLPPGTVLMSSRAPIGYLAIAANQVATNQGFKSFVCREGILPEYVYYWLEFARPLVEDMGSGSTFTEVSGSRCREIPLLLAPTREQKRIVTKAEELLARVNAAGERLARVPAILKRFRQAVLAAACSGRLTADWRKSRDTLNGEEEVPTSWRKVNVAGLASAEPRSIQSGPFGSNLRHSEFQATGVLAIGIDNVQHGRFSLGCEHRISLSKFEELKKYQARPGDVLITVMATIGRVCIVPDDLEPAIITKHVYRITVDRDQALPKYLMLSLMGDPDLISELNDQVRGQTRPGINGEILKSLSVRCPPLKEQLEIVRRVDALFKYAEKIEARIEAARRRADKIGQTVLAKAFRGELVPTEVELARAEGRPYEPASALLARIQASRAMEPQVVKMGGVSPAGRRREA